MRRALIAGAFALATIAGPAPADELDNQLSQIGATAAVRNWQALETYRGKLDDVESSTFRVRLPRGDYMVVGVCDNDCNDVDVKVSNSAGTKLAEDAKDDDYPIVGFSLASAGEVTIRVFMADCDVEPCAFAIRTYGK